MFEPSNFDRMSYSMLRARNLESAVENPSEGEFLLMNDVPTSQQEDYLEAIAVLLRLKRAARVGMIAERVGVHKSTVTAALHALSHKGWVNYHPYESVTLTPDGEVLAARVQRRHTIIERFLRDLLCLEGDRAARNACRLEHAVDAVVTDRLVKFMTFLDESDPALTAVARRFKAYCSERDEHGDTPEHSGDINRKRLRNRKQDESLS